MKGKSVLKIVFKVVYGIFKAILLCFLALFALLVCMQRVSNNTISLFGYRLFSVVTPSMAPKYNVGDVLLCEEVNVDTLVVGDDISYLGAKGTYKGKVITHRIIKIEKDDDGKKVFYTKGIATKNVDPSITEEQIYGKVKGQVPFLTQLYSFISTKHGFYIAIFVPLVLLIGSEVIVTMVDKFRNKKLKKKEEVEQINEPKNGELEIDTEKVEEISYESEEDKKRAEIKAEIERIQKEIEEKKRIEEEKKKAEIKAEIERIQKELAEKKKNN